ncbi:transmembrane sensor [Sphingomonas insulae]|uniref:FecR family protein n=1 Tax=Sphingomonas insulae TaxID=424800 RepID=A0ABN1HYB0_9SPHN|nr:FecR domain-containing protein [Sphingomonas insulae]NIJ29638.1 transmembrane sensor [Sphingomonas insulae]
MTAERRSAVDLEDDAALWLIRREEAEWNKEDDARLEAWLDQSVSHQAAFWRLEHGWRAADRIGALGKAGTGVRQRRRPSPHWRKTLFRVPRAAISAGIVASLSLAVGTVWWREPGTSSGKADTGDYRTPQGGRRSLTLADGSHVDLNTATRLRHPAGGPLREVWLDEGEAFFDIVHDPRRPFVVHAGPRTITVLGTRFSVRHDGARVTVVVLSGRVSVRDTKPLKPNAGGIVMTAGDVAVTQPGRAIVSVDRGAQTEALTAWRDGRVVFDDTTLGDAVAEFNRYSSLPMRIEDPAIARLKIGGSFRTDEGPAFVALLHRAYGVRVSRTGDAVILGR